MPTRLPTHYARTPRKVIRWRHILCARKEICDALLGQLFTVGAIRYGLWPNLPLPEPLLPDLAALVVGLVPGFYPSEAGEWKMTPGHRRPFTAEWGGVGERGKSRRHPRDLPDWTRRATMYPLLLALPARITCPRCGLGQLIDAWS